MKIWYCGNCGRVLDDDANCIHCGLDHRSGKPPKQAQLFTAKKPPPGTLLYDCIVPGKLDSLPDEA